MRVSGDQAAVVRYQGKKGVEHFCPERHWLPVSQQAALVHLKAKRTELVDLAGALHSSIPELSASWLRLD